MAARGVTKETVFKRRPFTLALIVVLLILLSPFINYGYLLAYKHYKGMFHITAPADPHFSIEDFDASNYAFIEDLGHALQELFPANTPRSRIDHVLIDTGKAQSTEAGRSGVVDVYYVFPSRSLPLPDIGVQTCGGKHNWSFHFHYLQPKVPHDKGTLLLQSITWVPFC